MVILVLALSSCWYIVVGGSGLQDVLQKCFQQRVKNVLVSEEALVVWETRPPSAAVTEALLTFQSLIQIAHILRLIIQVTSAKSSEWEFKDSVNPKSILCRSSPGFHWTCSMIFIRFTKRALKTNRRQAYINPSS